MIPDGAHGRVCALFCTDYARAYRMFSEDDGVTFGAPEEITSVFDTMTDTARLTVARFDLA